MTPDYTLYSYGCEVYKLVKHKNSGCGIRYDDVTGSRTEPESAPNGKLANNISRAKSAVLEYALCNEWDFFFTGTIDPLKLDRYDVDTYCEKFSQFIRNKRKKYGSKVAYLFVPEQHKDGAWHIHGLIAGIPAEYLVQFLPGAQPQKLINEEFLNWPDYAESFGFCSLGKIKNHVACARYISKYVSKQMAQDDRELGCHLYFHSRGLKRAKKIAEAYGDHPELDALLTDDYRFCSTGMIYDKNWLFPCQDCFNQHLECLDLSLPGEENQTEEELGCPEWETMQMAIEEITKCA